MLNHYVMPTCLQQAKKLQDQFDPQIRAHIEFLKNNCPDAIYFQPWMCEKVPSFVGGFSAEDELIVVVPLTY